MSVQPSLPSWKVEVRFVAPQFRIVVKCPLRTQKTTMNSVSPYYVNLILSYSYFVCHCSQWVDTSSIQQFLDLTLPDFLSYPFNLTLDLHCNLSLEWKLGEPNQARCDWSCDNKRESFWIHHPAGTLCLLWTWWNVQFHWQTQIKTFGHFYREEEFYYI